MHIALFNQHHHNYDCPGQGRHYTFLRNLAKNHQVTIVSASAWKNQRITDKYPWVPEGVNLIEVEVPYGNKMNIPQRLYSYSGYAWHVFSKGLKMPKPDVIWAVSTPLSTPWMAAKVAALRKVPFVFELLDLWPSFPIEMGAIKQKWMQDLLYKEEAKLYKQATHIITASPDMTDYVIGTGQDEKKVSTLVNGTDFDLIAASEKHDLQAFRDKLNIGNRKVVLYAGTFGRANDIPTILEASRLLEEKSDICFVFTGGGFFVDEIRKTAEKQSNVILLEQALPRHQVFDIYRIADISLVTFIDKPVLATNSPAKLYDSLAVGTPVIVTNPGWTKKFVEDHNCGWYVPAESPRELSIKIQQALEHPTELKQAGANGVAAAKEHFDRKILSEKLEQILIQAAMNK